MFENLYDLDGDTQRVYPADLPTTTRQPARKAFSLVRRACAQARLLVDPPQAGHGGTESA